MSGSVTARMLFVRAYPRETQEMVFDALQQQQELGRGQRGRRPVEVHAYADRIVIRQDGRIVAEHPAHSPPGRLFMSARA